MCVLLFLETVVLRAPTMIMDWCIYLLYSVICLLFTFGAILLDINKFRIIAFLWLHPLIIIKCFYLSLMTILPLKSIFSDLSKHTSLFWLVFIRCISAAAAKSLQSCLTLCDSIDSSPPSSSVPGILQARTLEWVAISFSNAWEWKVKVKSLSLVRLFVTPRTAAYQAPPSVGFSRQEYWSGLPFSSPPFLLFSTSLSPYI